MAILQAVDAPSLTLESLPLAGIGLALVAAALLAVGNELQSRGIAKASNPDPEASGFGWKQFRRLFKSRVWLLGTVALGLSIVVQLASLSLAPLIVVQPVGVAALVFAALITAWATRSRPSRRVVRAILVCVVGVGVFVTVAALVAKQRAIDDG